MTVPGVHPASSCPPAMVTGPGPGGPARAEAAGRAGGGGGRAAGDSCGALVSAPLLQLVECLAGQGAARPVEGLSGLAELVAGARRSAGHDPCDRPVTAVAALGAGRIPGARELLAALVADARTRGNTGGLPALLTCLAQALLFDGRHGDARATAAGALRIAQHTGQVQGAGELHGILAYLAAIDGDQERCHQRADAALAGPASAVTPATLSRGKLHREGSRSRPEPRRPARPSAAAGVRFLKDAALAAA